MQSTTWANKLFNSLSIEEQTNINNTQKHKALTELEQKRISDQDKRQLIYQRWTRTFSKKYGEFWPFYVENTCYDFPRAQQLRLDLFTQRAFQDHLQQKYGVQWLWKTQETSADCSLLHQMRCDYYDEVDRIRQKMEEDEIDEEKLIEDAKNHMKAKVWLKEITQAEYDEWFLLFNATKDYGFELDDWRDYFSGKYRHMDEGDKDYWRRDTWQDEEEPHASAFSLFIAPLVKKPHILVKKAYVKKFRPCSCCYNPLYN